MRKLLKWLGRMVFIAFLTVILLLILTILMPDNAEKAVEVIKGLTG
jgi:hypothetical protein